ncbi:hypothetical protein C4566_00795 [Candidatus Parcubacteria bacterium]|nr:MAG: hypothetical protein C4566_00795 [Candidatus Parcubacteria bacterium]
MSVEVPEEFRPENQGEKPKDKDPVVEKYLVFFRRLKDGYSNEIPKDLVHSTSESSRFKVRKGWFTALITQLEMFREDYLTDSLDSRSEPLVADVRNFVASYTSEDFKFLDRVRAEDIEAGDAILDKVISYLENL